MGMRRCHNEILCRRPYACPRTCRSAGRQAPVMQRKRQIRAAWLKPPFCLTEHLPETLLQRNIHVRHGGRNPQIGQAGDAMAAYRRRARCRRNASGPAPHSAPRHASVTQRLMRTPSAAILSSAAAALHPDADTAFAPFALDVEVRQRLDQPLLQVADIGAHVGRAALQVEHHIADALARPVIGELAAAAGAIDRKARIDQIGCPWRWCRRCRSADVPAARLARRPVPSAMAAARASICGQGLGIGDRPRR